MAIKGSAFLGCHRYTEATAYVVQGTRLYLELASEGSTHTDGPATSWDAGADY